LRCGPLVAAAGYILLLTLVALIFTLAYVMVTTLRELSGMRDGRRTPGQSCSGRKAADAAGEEEDEPNE